MTLSFVIMAAGVFFAGALTCSAIQWLTIPWIRRRATRLSLRAQQVLWTLLAAAPLIAAMTSLVAALLPSFGLAPDHCTTHEAHHPHLCLHHPQPISIAAALLATAGLIRFGMVFVREVRAALVARRTVMSLEAIADHADRTHVIPGRLPAAFVLGPLRPRLFLSRAMQGLPTRIVEPALAHETCHIAEHHLLVRLVVRLLGAFHLPAADRVIHPRLAAAQELEADAHAARVCGDPLAVAESLLNLTRARANAPAGALAFTDGGVEERIAALLEEPRDRPAWPLALFTASASLLAFAILASPAAVHHAFETALGWLH